MTEWRFMLEMGTRIIHAGAVPPRAKCACVPIGDARDSNKGRVSFMQKTPAQERPYTCPLDEGHASFIEGSLADMRGTHAIATREMRALSKRYVCPRDDGARYR